MMRWRPCAGAAAAGGGPDPQHPEAEILSGMTITDATAWRLPPSTCSEKYGCAVLCKGGHKVNDADDLLWRNGFGKWFHGKRIDNPNTHGTGCTLSSAIASNLAKGYDWTSPWSGPRNTSPARWRPCWIGSWFRSHGITCFALKGAFTE